MRGIYLSGDEEADPVGLPPMSLHVTLQLRAFCGILVLVFVPTRLCCASQTKQNTLAEDKRRLSASAYFRGRVGDKNSRGLSFFFSFADNNKQKVTCGLKLKDSIQCKTRTEAEFWQESFRN